MTIQIPWKDCYSLFITDEYVIPEHIVQDQFHGLSGLQYKVSIDYKTCEAKYQHTAPLKWC